MTPYASLPSMGSGGSLTSIRPSWTSCRELKVRLRRRERKCLAVARKYLSQLSFKTATSPLNVVAWQYSNGHADLGQEVDFDEVKPDASLF